MKKFLKALTLVLCALSAGIFVSACNGKASADYDNLKSQYDSVANENEENKAKLSWLNTYNSIEMGSTYAEVKALIGFDYLSYSGGEGTHEMFSYEWNNEELFGYAYEGENQITVVFCDGVAIYKQYGDDMLMILDSDNGTVFFKERQQATE